MRDSVTVAAIQMVSGPRVEENLALASELLSEAVSAGAELVLLPEYFPIIGATDAQRLAAREVPGQGPIQNWLAETAATQHIWLFGGSIPLLASVPDKMRNASLVFDPDGVCRARYDKAHLFSFVQGAEQYDEGASIEAGLPLPVVVDTPLARVGLSICYDLRFPEFYRAMLRQGTFPDLLLVPAAFTETTGNVHWEVLLRARAIENQCYVLAAGQGGTHENGRVTHGNSMLIDPWGEIVSRRDKGPGVILGQLSAAHLASIRTRLPALQHHHLQELP